MEWATVQHLDLRHAGGRRGVSARPLQQHAAAFRASQAIVAIAIGTHVIEFDALTGSKIAFVDLGARVVRMAYGPSASHVIIAILELLGLLKVGGHQQKIKTDLKNPIVNLACHPRLPVFVMLKAWYVPTTSKHMLFTTPYNFRLTVQLSSWELVLLDFIRP